MEIKELERKINLIQEMKQELENDVKELMSNESLSIDERFRVLVESGLGSRSWRTNFGLDRDDEFLYEGPCYMSKYETRGVDGILECLQEDKGFGFTKEEEQIFKRYCVENCISTMVFDW